MLIILLPFLATGILSSQANINVHFQLVEECSLGTLVGHLSEAVNQNGLHYPFDGSNKAVDGGYQWLSSTSLFRLDKRTGGIYTKSRIDRESICTPSSPAFKPDHDNILGSSHLDLSCFVNLQVLRTSGYQMSPESTVILVRVYLLDINDNAPSWQEKTINLTIPEHTPSGSRFPLPTANDKDCGPENTTSRYFILTQPKPDDNLFHQSSRIFQLDPEPISESEGSNFGIIPENRWNSDFFACSSPKFRLWLRVTGDLDYETADDLNFIKQKQSFHNIDKSHSHYSLTIAAVDGSRLVPQTGTIKLNINVKDINDHAPYFLIPDSSSVDGLYARLKVDGIFRPSTFIIEVQENAPVGQTIYTPRIVEPDESDIDHLVFGFDSSVSAFARAMFNVRESDGVVSLKQSPDYEKQTSFMLPITVSDGKHVASQDIRINVVNLNDHAPVITIRPVSFSKHSLDESLRPETSASNTSNRRYKPVHLEIEENWPPNSFIATVSVTDADQPVKLGLSNQGAKDVNDVFHCQLGNDGLAFKPLFEGSSSQFKLLTRNSFDREQTSELFVTLTCYDSGHPRHTSQVGIKLRILDRNDNKPVFKHLPMSATIKENAPVDTIVYRFEAFDVDVGENAALVYAITGEGANQFKLNSETGFLTTQDIFDREKVSSFNLMVSVKDRRGLESGEQEPVNEATSMLTINVLDENDCPPIFDQLLYQFIIDENTKVDTVVGEVKARDNDVTADNNKVRYFMKYEIMNQAYQDFRVLPDGRIIVARESLDRETMSLYLFTVIASDSGKTPLSSTAQVQIHISDTNDNSPVWLFPPESNSIVNVTIREPMGHQVALLRAKDPDQAENGEVIFKIANISLFSARIDPGAEFSSYQNITKSMISVDSDLHQDIFELDPSTGALYVARALRTSDLGLLKLVIEAKDLGVPSRSTFCAILINIMDYQPVLKVSTGELDKPNRSSSTSSFSFQHQDLVVIVVMVAVAIVISLFLIVAMLFLRCPLCLFRDRDQNQNHPRAPMFNQNLPTNAFNSHYLPEVFRDSHVTYVGDGNCENTIGKDGSLNSTDETWLYPSLVPLVSERDTMMASRNARSSLPIGENKTILKMDEGRGVGYDRSQAAFRSFLLLNKQESSRLESGGRPPIEMTTLTQSNQLSANNDSSGKCQQAVFPSSSSGDPGLSLSKSISCLSGITPPISPTDYASDHELIVEEFGRLGGVALRSAKSSNSINTVHKNRTIKSPECHSNTTLLKPSEIPNCAEAICLLPSFTEVCSQSPNSVGGGRDKRYAVILNNPKRSTLGGRQSQEKVRYVEVRTPDNRGDQSMRSARSRSNQRTGDPPCVSWMEPEYQTCYLDPRVELQRPQQATTGNQLHQGFPPASKVKCPVASEIDQGYAHLGKTDTVPYDNLVHTENQLNDFYRDFQNSVI